MGRRAPCRSAAGTFFFLRLLHFSNCISYSCKQSDGTGAMPIGNGDVAAGVWVDQDTGDLRMHVSKSDVFDENSQPVKVGVLRLTFDPPLWQQAPPPAPLPPGTTCSPTANYTASASGQSVIGDQSSQFSPSASFKCSSAAKCVAESAALCCSIPACRAFSLNGAWGGGVVPELFTDTKTNVGGTPGSGWTTWTSNAPPGPPPATGFQQTLDLTTSTVTVKTKHVTVSIAVELNAPMRDGVAHRDAGILHIVANSTLNAAPFSVKASLEPYREEGKKTALGRGFCYPRFEHADTIVPDAAAVTWYHWNHLNTTYYNDTLLNQGVDPATPGLADMFTHLAWGGSLSGDAGFNKPSPGPTGLAVATKTPTTTAALKLKLLTLKVDDPAIWIAEIAKVTTAPPGTPSPPGETETQTTWAEINDRSYIQLTGRDAESAASAKQITDHVNWDRYLALVQGRVAFGPIKFNGQAFNCNNTGKGWDTRDWGADYWWQNERQPYYNAVAQGDLDTMRAFLDFYLRMLPYVEARTKVQFKGTATPLTAGALYEETCTQFGVYNEGDWGCHSSIPRPHGASANTYIRFHWTGALELALMVLDLYDATGDIGDLVKYVPMAEGVVEGYRQRFPNKDHAGKIDMWPSQALETYQCKDPTSRDECGTNPSTDIAGLMAVLPRLIGVAAVLNTSSSTVAVWKQFLADLPPMPMDAAGSGAKYSKMKVAAMAKRPKGRSNSENTELYVAHPFRIYGYGKPDIEDAQQAYLERHSPCNDGWCQDIIQAAMLNMTDEAADQLVQRAKASDHGGFRFEGFAGHYQDYEPSLDHYGFMRTGLDYMLIAPADDAAGSVTLFPTFPTDRWDVSFKLHAPKNTTIEASCVGGKLAYLTVTPPERAADVHVVNCQQ